MSGIIANIINYDDTDKFIDLMGGSGRILINKPAHETEVYNDISKGLCALIKVLSEVEYRGFVRYLLDTSRYCESEFEKARDIFLRVEAGEVIEEYAVAKAVYEVFSQSRDSMGEVWHRSKYSSQQGYLNRTMRLYKAGRRLQGVEVRNLDVRKVWMEPDCKEASIVRGWLENPRNMIYIDPSYIDPKSERELLLGVDVENTEDVCGEIDKLYGRMPKDLGVAYVKSFNYREHEEFVRIIADSKAKILLSNYNAVLLRKYLNRETGWKNYSVETIALAGMKNGMLDKRREEVLFWNY